MAGWGRQAWGPGGGPGGGDTTPPSVVFNPVSGTPIVPSTVIECTITDDFLKRSQLTAEFPGGAWEVIFMQGRFASNYVNSTRQILPNGFKFFIERVGGWPSTPTIHADPYDTSANEA